MYERRLKALLILVAAVVVLVMGRLVQLQLLRGAEYRTQAEEMLICRPEYLPTVRGRILDRKGRPLAVDEPCFELCLDYRMLSGGSPESGQTAYDRRAKRRWERRQVRRIARVGQVPIENARELFDQRRQEKWKRTWALAAELTGATANEMFQAAERILSRVEALRRARGGAVEEEGWAHAVVSRLDEATAVKVRSRLDEMIGASVRPSHRRRYPRGHDACHVIGRVGQVTAAQYAEARRRADAGDDVEARLSGYLHGDVTGRTGVEKACEDILRGRYGRLRRRRIGETIEQTPPRFGKDVHLTLDVELQRALVSVLGRAGAIVVIDVPTGEVLAMVSLPTYDLNSYRRQFRQLNADRDDLPLWDRTVAVRYPPGSTVKPIVALAGLTTGRISAGSEFICRGYLHQPGAFRCWSRKGGHGSIAVLGAIEHSCNVFFYNLGQRLGLDRLGEWMGMFGYADVPGTGLAERAGLVPSEDWIRRKQRRAPVPGDARFMAIGQAGIEVTVMHVANAMATIARDGEFRTPLLVRELAPAQRRRKLKIDPAALELVQRGMHRVVESGTARNYARDPAFDYCAKTGTAQTAPRRVDGRIVRSGDTAWYVGFAPYRNPRIAFAVMVEYAQKGGGRLCGPKGLEVLRRCRAFGYLD